MLVIHCHNQPELISLDVEDNSLRRNDAGAPMLLLQLRGVLPGRAGGHGVPRIKLGFHAALQPLLHSVAYKANQRAPRNDPHSLRVHLLPTWEQALHTLIAI